MDVIIVGLFLAVILILLFYYLGFIMLKSFKFLFLFILSLPLIANATLLPLSNDISDEEGSAYIVYDNRDWAWVSPVNTQFHDCAAEISDADLYLTIVLENSGCSNQLLAPQYREDWRFATQQELIVIFDTLTLNAFYDEDKSKFIQATEYWNTNFVGIDYLNFAKNFIAGEWSDNIAFETFYVRTHSSNPQPVPEPSTLMIFALGLIVLASKKKLFFALTNKALH